MVYLDIISGFLGAGKTTFTNKLLEFYMASGEKPIYIVNEYGEAGLDAQILKHEGFEAVEMTNGCICCTLKGEMVRTVAKIMQTYHPTRIVFEPSGVFMFESFFDILKNPALAGQCEIGNIVTVIDAAHYKSSRLVFGNFIYDQIQSAPVLFISKLDTLPENYDLSEIVCDVKNINQQATILTDGYDGLTPAVMKKLFLQKSAVHDSCCTCDACSDAKHLSEHTHDHACCSHEHHHHHEHHHDRECCGEDHEHMHHEKLDVCTLVLQRDFTQETLDAFFEDIRNGVFGQLVRVKGILYLNGKAQLLNATFDEITIKPYPCFETTAMTFIGKNLNDEAINALA